MFTAYTVNHIDVITRGLLFPSRDRRTALCAMHAPESERLHIIDRVPCLNSIDLARARQWRNPILFNTEKIRSTRSTSKSHHHKVVFIYTDKVKLERPVMRALKIRKESEKIGNFRHEFTHHTMDDRTHRSPRGPPTAPGPHQWRLHASLN